MSLKTRILKACDVCRRRRFIDRFGYYTLELFSFVKVDAFVSILHRSEGLKVSNYAFLFFRLVCFLLWPFVLYN